SSTLSPRPSASPTAASCRFMQCSRANISASASSARCSAPPPWYRASAWRSARWWAGGSTIASAPTLGSTSARSRWDSARSPSLSLSQGDPMKITPFLWFDNQAEEAVKFYLSVFRKGKAGKPLLDQAGEVIALPFEMQGQKFTALNGGPQFKFNESVSFVV